MITNKVNKSLFVFLMLFLLMVVNHVVDYGVVVTGVNRVYSACPFLLLQFTSTDCWPDMLVGGRELIGRGYTK